MAHVFIIGGTTFDHIVGLEDFPQPLPQTIHQAAFFEATGSTGSGKALCLQQLNVPCSLYSLLGDDVYGKHIINYMKQYGVNFIYDIDPAGTERHINIMNAAGNRISMFITQSSEHPVTDHALIKKNIAASDLVVLNIIAYCKDLIPLLKDYHNPIWTDLHDYTDDNPYHQPFIDRCKYIFLSSDNLTNYKHTMQQLITGKELVVCTHGKNGSTALTKNGEWINVPALTGFNIVDTNGAGDNFFSGFLYAYLNGKAIKECMQYGSICGALCITSKQLVAEQLSNVALEEFYLRYYSGAS